MVRRYDLKEGSEDYEAEMVEHQSGDWVSYDDYEAVAEEVNDLRKIIADAIERLRDA